MDTDNDSDDNEEFLEKRIKAKNTKMTRMDAIKNALDAKRKKNRCKRCKEIGHFVPDCSTLTEKEKEQYNEERQKNRERRKEKSEKLVKFEEEFDILNSPCGLTINQVMRYIPAYREHVKRVFRKGKQEKVNFISTTEKERSSVMRCNAGIEGEIVEAIIDSGAEITAISRRLMERIGYEIEEPSKIIIKSANDQKERSLGRIRKIEIILEGVEIVVPNIEVIENSEELLILGNDWIKKSVKNIDIENDRMKIIGKNEVETIPIKFTREIEEEEYESEDDLREVHF